MNETETRAEHIDPALNPAGRGVQESLLHQAFSGELR
jgi:hypothetical protein